MKKLPLTVLLSFTLIAGEFIPTSSQVKVSGQDRAEVRMSDVVTDDDEVSYHGYVIRKRSRKVRIDEGIEGRRPYFADDEYARLIHNGYRVLRFDGIYAPAGNSISFGLFSLLGGNRKQLLVSQDTFRGGNQWVVNLAGSPHVIYDGKTWLTGREVDDMSVLDLDGDGIYEISVPTSIFYGFEGLCPGCTPLPTIIFKYSKKAATYLPANPQFADYLLTQIENGKRTIQAAGSPPDNMNHLGDVLGIVLDYIFAGRAREAWTFYDHAYKLPDKGKIKREIRSELRSSPVYRFIYHKPSRRRTT